MKIGIQAAANVGSSNFITGRATIMLHFLSDFHYDHVMVVLYAPQARLNLTEFNSHSSSTITDSHCLDRVTKTQRAIKQNYKRFVTLELLQVQLLNGQHNAHCLDLILSNSTKCF